MNLAIRHVTTYGYTPAVPAVTMRLKLFPSRAEGQLPHAWTVTVNGRKIRPELTDSWGDKVATVFARGEIETLEIVAEGKVETVDHAGVLKGHRCAIRPGVCLRATPRTRPSAAITALARDAAAAAEGGSPLDQAHALMEAVADAVRYKAGATDPATTAAAALEAGEGVCQDHAHLLITGARSLGWPARYVAGYYLPDPSSDEPLETHAWGEIWMEGLGWVGFDPTHRLCPTDSYVRLSSGLDSYDAAPIRGHAVGTPDETLTAAVTMGVVGQSQSQSQS
jgi:transglutaminase-like putative cysteine protease